MAESKLDLRESIIEAFYGAKEAVGSLVEDFQNSDRFFKYKLGIILAWVLLSLTTIGLACPGSGGANSLGAKVRVTKVVEDTSILIKNESSVNWSDVRIKMNGTYTAYTPAIPGGGNLVLTLKQFAGPSGQVPPKGLQPATVEINCSQGLLLVDLNKPEEQ